MRSPLITTMRARFVPLLAALLPLGCGGKVIVDGLGGEGGGSGGSGVLHFAVAPESLSADKVQPADSGLSPDGDRDGVFDATVAGPIRALLVVSTDADGVCVGGQQYDTIVGMKPMPAGVSCGYSLGQETWVLGVANPGSDKLLNLPDGSLPPMIPGISTLKLYGANILGLLGSGALRWQLIVEFNDGSTARSEVVAY